MSGVFAVLCGCAAVSGIVAEANVWLVALNAFASGANVVVFVWQKARGE